MHWLTIAYAMTAAACLTLAALHFLVWFKQPARRAHLAFAMTAIFVAAITPFELAMARAQTAAEFGTAVRWIHLPAAFLVFSLVWFLWVDFRTGRLWLACVVCGLRMLTLILNFSFTSNINYREISGLQHVQIFGGESVSAAVGVASTWALIPQLSLLFLLLYMLDASVTLWRRGDRGERRRAVVVGGSMVFFILTEGGHVALILTGLIVSPVFLSFPFMAIVAAMAYELSLDVVQAGQLSAAVKTNEQRLSLAQEAGQIGAFDWDIHSGELRWTEKLGSIYGIPPGGFGGTSQSWRELVHPEDLLRCDADVNKGLVQTHGSWQTQFRIVRADDREIRWIDASGRFFFDAQGKPVRMLGVNRDVTERRQVEEAKNNLAAIVESSEDAILRKTLDGIITSWNGGAEKMYGYSAAEMVGQHVSTLVPDELKKEVTEILEGIGRGELVDHLETTRLTRDGRRFQVSLTISAIKDEYGKIIGAATIARDITDRKRNEHALQQLAGRLLMLQDEEQRRVAGELHDGLGQSLAIIKNRALIGLQDQTNHSLAMDQLGEIAETATAAILEVREIAHNLRPYQLDRLGLIAAINFMIARVSESTALSLSADMERIDGLLSPEAETSVYRIVQEGLNNVVKHSSATTARVEIKRGGDKLAISVQDNGKGITPAAPSGNGIKRGVGFAGIAERVRLLGGSFAIDSQPGRGTTLTVRLELTGGGE